MHVDWFEIGQVTFRPTLPVTVLRLGINVSTCITPLFWSKVKTGIEHGNRNKLKEIS